MSSPTRGDVAAALYRSPTAADFRLSTDACNLLADAVMALLAEAPQPRPVSMSSLYLEDGNGTVYLAEQVGWQDDEAERLFVVDSDPENHADDLATSGMHAIYRLTLNASAPPEAPQPRVLWRGDLNDLLHAVNGTPILSPLLDAAVAPDDPDAHKIRVVVIEDTENQHEADECYTCGEPEGVEGECLKSERPCGHHCNHVWTSDACHWCGAEFAEDTETPACGCSPRGSDGGPERDCPVHGDTETPDGV